METAIPVSSCQALRKLVSAAGSQKRAAERLCISQGNISDLLRGRRPFTALTLAKIRLYQTGHLVLRWQP